MQKQHYGGPVGKGLPKKIVLGGSTRDYKSNMKKGVCRAKRRRDKSNGLLGEALQELGVIVHKKKASYITYNNWFGDKKKEEKEKKALLEQQGWLRGKENAKQGKTDENFSFRNLAGVLYCSANEKGSREGVKRKSTKAHGKVRPRKSREKGTSN